MKNIYTGNFVNIFKKSQFSICPVILNANKINFANHLLYIVKVSQHFPQKDLERFTHYINLSYKETHFFKISNNFKMWHVLIWVLIFEKSNFIFLLFLAQHFQYNEFEVPWNQINMLLKSHFVSFTEILKTFNQPHFPIQKNKYFLKIFLILCKLNELCTFIFEYKNDSFCIVLYSFVFFIRFYNIVMLVL